MVILQLIPLRFLNGQAPSLSFLVLPFLLIGCTLDSIDDALQLRLHLGRDRVWGLRGTVRRSKRTLRLFWWTPRQWRIVSMIHFDWFQFADVCPVSLCASSRSVSGIVISLVWLRRLSCNDNRYSSAVSSGDIIIAPRVGTPFVPAI